MESKRFIYIFSLYSYKYILIKFSKIKMKIWQAFLKYFNYMINEGCETFCIIFVRVSLWCVYHVFEAV